MNTQLHKRFQAKEVIDLFERYLSHEVELQPLLTVLKIKRSQFYLLLGKYQKDPNSFTLEYQRSKPSNKISAKAEKMIVNELTKEKSLIDDKRNPVSTFNYSYIRDVLAKDHGVKVSLPTIIARAKKMNFMSAGRPRRSTTVKS